MTSPRISDLFRLDGKVVIVTGGGGMLGYQHAATIADIGGTPVLLDISAKGLERNRAQLEAEHGVLALTIEVDLTDVEAVRASKERVMSEYGRVDVLVNNAAHNPKVEDSNGVNFSRLENMTSEQWRGDLEVGLGGAFNCAKVYGPAMVEGKRGGVIVNIASDLSVIAPDQRLYSKPDLPRDQQPVKPVTYSVVKHGLIGLTKYLATYWCDEGIRCNALSPGGVYAGQNDVFVSQLVKLIPAGRMATQTEYRGVVAFLCSDASAYLNGANLVMDGGRSVW